MSAYTTIKVGRSAARKYLLNCLLGATDEQLEPMLDLFLSDRLYNALVVDDDEATDDEVIGE